MNTEVIWSNFLKSIKEQITSLAFDHRLQVLAVAYINPTIHVFKIPQTIKGTFQQEEMTWKVPESGKTYLSFDKNSRLIVGHQNGSLYVLRYDIANNTIVHESTTLLTTMLNATS